MATPGTHFFKQEVSRLDREPGAGKQTGHMIYRRIDSMDKDRQDRTRIRGFVSRHRKGERGDREAGGKGGRRDRYGNPGEKGGR